MAAPGPLKIHRHSNFLRPAKPAADSRQPSAEKSNLTRAAINFKTGRRKAPLSPSPTSPEVSSRWAPAAGNCASKRNPGAAACPLQSTGTLQVRGEVAGTSARLQPAEILVQLGQSLHRRSLPHDHRQRLRRPRGFRFSTAAPASANRNLANGFHLARGNFPCTLAPRKFIAGISPNAATIPASACNLKGLWDVAAGEARTRTYSLSISPIPISKALPGSKPPECRIGICASKIPGIQAQDLLAWVPGVSTRCRGKPRSQAII